MNNNDVVVILARIAAVGEFVELRDESRNKYLICY